MSSFEKENSRYRYIVTIVDVFSRNIGLEKMKTKDAISAREALKRAINRAGISPNNLISDNGTEFLWQVC
jgi:transposase InsO family protein